MLRVKDQFTNIGRCWPALSHSDDGKRELFPRHGTHSLYRPEIGGRGEVGLGICKCAGAMLVGETAQQLINVSSLARLLVHLKSLEWLRVLAQSRF